MKAVSQRAGSVRDDRVQLVRHEPTALLGNDHQESLLWDPSPALGRLLIIFRSTLQRESERTLPVHHDVQGWLVLVVDVVDEQALPI